MIYFAQLPGGSIKIGFTDNLETRLLQLGSHYGTELALLATMPGDRSVETEIHERFAHYRLGRTEQFRPGADLMAFLGKPLLVGANPDTIETVSPRAVTVKLDSEVVRLAKIVAAYRGLSVADYLSESLRPIAQRDLLKEQAKASPAPREKASAARGQKVATEEGGA